MVLFTFLALQEALSEFEVVNMEGKTSDALIVCNSLLVKQNKIDHFPSATGTFIVPKNLSFQLTTSYVSTIEKLLVQPPKSNVG